MHISYIYIYICPIEFPNHMIATDVHFCRVEVFASTLPTAMLAQFNRYPIPLDVKQLQQGTSSRRENSTSGGYV